MSYWSGAVTRLGFVVETCLLVKSTLAFGRTAFAPIAIPPGTLPDLVALINQRNAERAAALADTTARFKAIC